MDDFGWRNGGEDRQAMANLRQAKLERLGEVVYYDMSEPEAVLLEEMNRARESTI